MPDAAPARSPLELPANLVEDARRDNRHAVEKRAWLARLPDIVAELAGRWSLQLGPPFQPGGSCSWVAPARDSGGRDLVLKVGWRHDEGLYEAIGLRVWAGRGAVIVHETHATDVTSALLLERCRPGVPLGWLVPEPDQDPVVAALLLRLWVKPPADERFPALQAMCEAWASALEERLAGTAARLDPGLVRSGLELFRRLPADADDELLLCTDLHAGNILSAQREPWLAIDPKPHVGDPTYDTLQHVLNCEERLVADPGGLAARMAGLTGLDRRRLEQWLFARCVVESVDRPRLREVARRLAPT